MSPPRPSLQFPVQQAAARPPSNPMIRPISYEADGYGGPLQPLQTFVGYDDGFVIANHGYYDIDQNEYPFLTRINSWSHLRHTLFDSDGPNRDQNSFSFERLRLSFAGHAFTPDLGYFLQFDGGSDRSSETIILDYFLTYDLSQVCGFAPGKLGVKAGKWKVPFSRSREESGRRLQFADRASANIVFDLNRSLGVGLYGEADCLGLPIGYETAVFNGFRSGNSSTGGREQIDRNFGWSMRTQTDLFSAFGDDGEPDLSFHEFAALRLGSGIAYTRKDREGGSEFGRPRGVDSGLQIAGLLPPGVRAYDLWLYTIDAHWKYRGFSLIGEYYWRSFGQFRGAPVPSLNDDGFVLQGGYFIIPESIEVVTRWSRITGDSGTLGLTRQSSDEVGGGVVFYLNGHNAKLTMDINHYNGVPVSSSRMDLLPGDVGWLMRTQVQVAF